MKSILIVLLATAAVASAGEWIITTVDDYEDEVGAFCEIALDGEDVPHIAYWDAVNHSPRYAFYDGSSWCITVIDPMDRGGYLGLALDEAGYPHICYAHQYWPYGAELKYAFYDGSTWYITMVDDNGYAGNHCSIALDSQGRPHIAYGEHPESLVSHLKYAYFDGDEWRIEYVEHGNVGCSIDIALDSQDRPHISYRDGDLEHLWLKYAYHDGVSWHLTAVDTTSGPTGHGTSIAIDSHDRPHISYQEDATEAVKYAYYDGSTWHITVIDDDHVRSNTSIALDEAERPHISYCALWGTRGSLYTSEFRYAYFDGAEWQVEVIEEGGEDCIVGDWNSLVLDSYWFPHIAYSNVADFVGFISLKYAYSVGNYLNYFTAAPDRPGALVLSWSIKGLLVGEFLGYNLYRRDAGSESDWLNVNDELIAPAEPCSFVESGLVRDFTYEYMLEGIREGGAAITLGINTGTPTAPAAFALNNPRPNPSTTSAVVPFELYDLLYVKLTVYDISGRKVATLAEEWMPPGAHERTVSGLVPGVYVCKLEAENYSETRKMVVQ